MSLATNPIIIRRVEEKDLESIVINDISLYRTSIDGSKSMTLDWIIDFYSTFKDGICVAEDTTDGSIVGHGICFSFDKRYDETNFEFIYNTNKVSSLHQSHSKTVFGKTFVVKPEYRKYHVAYGLFKWMVLSITKKYPEVKYVLALCESDNPSRKLHYAMGYRPKHVFNKIFQYSTKDIVDGLLLEIDIETLYSGFAKDTYKKWFGVTGIEPQYIYYKD